MPYPKTLCRTGKHRKPYLKGGTPVKHQPQRQIPGSTVFCSTVVQNSRNIPWQIAGSTICSTINSRSHTLPRRHGQTLLRRRSRYTHGLWTVKVDCYHSYYTLPKWWAQFVGGGQGQLNSDWQKGEAVLRPRRFCQYPASCRPGQTPHRLH